MMVIPYSDASIHEVIHTSIDGSDDEWDTAETNSSGAPLSDRGGKPAGV